MEIEWANVLKKKGSGKHMMIKLFYQWVCSTNQTNTTLVHNPVVALNVDRHRHSQAKNVLEDYFISNLLYYSVDFRGQYRLHPYLFRKIMHDVAITTNTSFRSMMLPGFQVDEIARIRKSTILECLVRFCDVIETLYTKDYLCKSMSRDLKGLLQIVEA
ncbi:unnamed protein product [Prunus armeniaca]